ncbi:MAG: PrgI family protein [Faecousia sp.]
MEVKINREIRDYHESMFMGLSLRQSVFSLLAILVAVGLYFWLNPILGTEMVSWVCILGAVPFAVLGFVSYHGMPAEKFAWVWFRSEILEPRQFCCKPNNVYYELMKDTIAKHEKEAKNTHESD